MSGGRIPPKALPEGEGRFSISKSLILSSRILQTAIFWLQKSRWKIPQWIFHIMIGKRILRYVVTRAKREVRVLLDALKSKENARVLYLITTDSPTLVSDNQAKASRALKTGRDTDRDRYRPFRCSRVRAWKNRKIDPKRSVFSNSHSASATFY